MKIDVPLILQSKDSVDCGIYGLAMILKYYKKNISYDKLRKELATDQVGTYAPQLGSYLIKNGFDITLITLHPSIFTMDDKSMKHKDIMKRIADIYSKTNNKQKRKVLNYFLKFLRNGGQMKIKIPDENDIKKEITAKRPLGALLTTNFMNGKSPKFNFHFNVITGIDNKYIYANDPMWDERGGEKKYPKKDFFYGVYASAYGDIDNACLMIIKPKDSNL